MHPGLIPAGASLAYVRDQLGHSSIQVTVDLYGNLVPSANVGWVDGLDQNEQTTSQGRNATPAQPETAGDSNDQFTEWAQVIERDEEIDGGPGQSRTADQRFRKPLLYPSELRGQCDVTPLSHVSLARSALRESHDLVSRKCPQPV